MFHNAESNGQPKNSSNRKLISNHSLDTNLLFSMYSFFVGMVISRLLGMYPTSKIGVDPRRHLEP
jgi:hypothetical protein